MPFVIFVAPFLTPVAARQIAATADLPDIQLGLISQEPQERLPEHIQRKLAAHWRVDDGWSTSHILGAARMLAERNGPIYRLFGATEHLQVQLAQVREELGLPGIGVETTWNFRDKARMKTLLREAGLPCARHWLVNNDADMWRIANEVGYPLVIKPPSGAGAASTFRANGPEDLQAIHLEPEQTMLIEEFVTGDEFSFETISIDGQAIWHSLTHYLPTPLEVLRTPWIQWRVLLPSEIDDPRYDDIRQEGRRALEVLGMQTGMSHMEWFRRRDGSIAISEVAARPPGAQITTLISYAHDIDMVQAWTRLMVYGEFEPPTRKYAAGAVYLRGQGFGRVKALHGLEQAQEELGSLVVEAKLPEIGQQQGDGYEGVGFIIVRHPETAVVEDALSRLAAIVRVELIE